MGDALLSGLMGGLQGAVQGLQYRQQQEEDELRQQWVALTNLYERGDPTVRQIAAQGLAELAQKGVKYKGTHIQDIRDYMTASIAPGGDVAVAPAGTVTGVTGGMPAPGAAVPPPGAAAPPSLVGGAPPGPPTAGAAPTAPTAPTVPTAPAVPTLATPAALPPTSPTAATGSSAGQGPGAPTTGIGPALEQARAITGPPPAPPPGRDELAARLAAEFGYTPEELEDPNFMYRGGLADPQKQKIQVEYRRRLTEGERISQGQYRTERTSYEATIRSLVAQTLQGERQATTIEAAETRREVSARAAEVRREKAAEERRLASEERARETLVKSAKLQLTRALQAAEKLMQPSGEVGRLMARNPQVAAQYEAQAEAYRQTAFDNYEAITGEPAPGREAPGGGAAQPPALPPGSPPLLATRGPSPARAPALPAVRVTKPAGGLRGGPPGAPITPAEERRAAQIKQRFRRQNMQSSAELSQEDRDFLLDYFKRGGQ